MDGLWVLSESNQSSTKDEVIVIASTDKPFVYNCNYGFINHWMTKHITCMADCLCSNVPSFQRAAQPVFGASFKNINDASAVLDTNGYLPLNRELVWLYKLAPSPVLCMD